MVREWVRTTVLWMYSQKISTISSLSGRPIVQLRTDRGRLGSFIPGIIIFKGFQGFNQEFRHFSFAAAEVFTTVLPCGGPFLAQIIPYRFTAQRGRHFWCRHGLRNEHNQYKGAARHAAVSFNGLFWWIFNTDSMKQWVFFCANNPASILDLGMVQQVGLP